MLVSWRKEGKKRTSLNQLVTIISYHFIEISYKNLYLNPTVFFYKFFKNTF